jgi:hypothetical protein
MPEAVCYVFGREIIRHLSQLFQEEFEGVWRELLFVVCLCHPGYVNCVCSALMLCTILQREKRGILLVLLAR